PAPRVVGPAATSFLVTLISGLGYDFSITASDNAGNNGSSATLTNVRAPKGHGYASWAEVYALCGQHSPGGSFESGPAKRAGVDGRHDGRRRLAGGRGNCARAGLVGEHVGGGRRG